MTSTDCTLLISGAKLVFFDATARSIENFTAAASSGVPSVNFRFGRRVKRDDVVALDLVRLRETRLVGPVVLRVQQRVVDEVHLDEVGDRPRLDRVERTIRTR